MPCYRVLGGGSLVGETRVKAAKNAVLPLLAAGLLCEGPIRLGRCPRLMDIFNMLDILRALGCEAAMEGECLSLDARGANCSVMPETLSKQLRSSIFMLGPVLSRFGEAHFTYPGGCEIGLRPIDLHLSSLRAMGVEIREEGGHILCKGKPKGAHIHLDYPSVGATENVLMASACAKGETVLTNAAREPEVCDLIAFLTACGAQIKGAGTDTLEVRGVPSLRGCDYIPIVDRIVAGTLLLCAPVTLGDVYVRGAVSGDLQAVLSKLTQMGCQVLVDTGGVRCRCLSRPKAVRRIETNPHPGFPTDMQAQFMAALVTACGTSILIENVFENRFAHAVELVRMGADIQLGGRVAVVRGVPLLRGTTLSARDLRGGAALLLAALGAEGESVVEDISHVERGYERIDEQLTALGAKVRRED